MSSSIQVRIACAFDAPGIARCFKEAYEGSYPNPWVLDARALAARIETGSSIFAIAVDGDTIAGTTALEPREDGTGDLCHGAVLPSHRRLGLFTLMHAPLVALARELELSALFGRCVTSHPYSQRALASTGSVVTGLSLSVAPRTMRFLGIQEQLSQREACFDTVLLLAPRTIATVHVPRELRPAVAFVYSLLGTEYRFAPRAFESRPLRVSLTADDDLGIVTLRLGTRGRRPARALDEELARLDAQGAEAIFVELPLSSPAAPGSIDALRERGFSFAAVLPGRGEDGADALRLQRPREEVSTDTVIADVAGADRLRSLVFADRLTVGAMTVA